MKKILSTLILITLVIVAKAQFQPGNMYVGGSVYYDSYNTKAVNSGYGATKRRQLGLLPTVGVFLTPKLSVGISPIYSYSKEEISTSTAVFIPNNSVSSHMLGGALELRYYINITDKFAFYPALSGGYRTSVSSNYYDKDNVYSAALTPNFVYFATRKIAINLGFGAIQWSKQKQTYKDSDGSFTANSFGINLNNGAYVGVAHYF